MFLINKGQNVKLEKAFIKFKNFNGQIPGPFKIYADFECLLKSVDCGVDNDFIHILKHIKTTFHVVLLIKLFVSIINLVKMLLCIGVKTQILNLLDLFLKNMVIVEIW